MGSPCSRPRPVTLALLVVGLALPLVACGASDDAATGAVEGPTRLVEHARGQTEVPESPQRVVVLEPVQLDTAVALGVVPVGAAVLSEETGVPDYLGEEAAGIEPVGTVPEPNLEEIAALEPDLILGTESRHSALYDKLAGIAPTVFMETQEDPWQDNVGLVAEALGDVPGAESLLDEYDARCAEVAESHDTAGRTAQLVRPRDGLFSLYGPESFAGSTLECAGFSTPERDWEGSISVDLSPELVSEASADLVLVTTPDTEDPAAVPDVMTGRAFPAVHPVDESFWITGVGPLGGLTVLDDLDRLLAQP